MTKPALDTEFAYVNDLVDGYDESPFDARMRGYMLRALAPYLHGGSALQIGCYHGDLTVLLEQRYASLTIVDAAQRFLDHTRRRLARPAAFHCSLFETLDLPARFDAVFLVHVLEHVIDPVAVLGKIRGALNERGLAFVVVPNGNAASRQLAVKMGLLDHNAALTPADLKHGHRRVYQLDTLEADLRRAGLDIVNTGGIFFKPLANFQFDRLGGGEIITEAYMEACYQLGFKYPDLSASIYAVCRR
ncbi:MAG TPA: class I SAM-dependent methyltransferase [Stellaceae bacterium]|nr:class I SAM-dependent methyltransferase [Stellaceae bacterium]